MQNNENQALGMILKLAQTHNFVIFFSEGNDDRIDQNFWNHVPLIICYAYKKRQYLPRSSSVPPSTRT